MLNFQQSESTKMCSSGIMCLESIEVFGISSLRMCVCTSEVRATEKMPKISAEGRKEEKKTYKRDNIIYFIILSFDFGIL